ncbi:hypothetical protein DO021_20265 [Desulfobacter hydrogenophilus]|uniref:Uncharacterized protein n=1 Tax=Desulfobacter hydrogenophilus TaxID=2291 RepID=A0A328F7P9_9BACT|nr:hypothetical protein DO021_20265 [Desulfobacter hydrogenophilus]
MWASAYSERSYLWRQKYLSNPANVFPSILLLPSVDVQRSDGVDSGLQKKLPLFFKSGSKRLTCCT